MSLAYHILAHKSPEQVDTLLSSIWHEDNVYVIHYDKRRPRSEHAAIAALTRNKTNVIVQKPRAVLWGRYSLLSAQLEGLSLALSHSKKWTHWINLSGQCLPLLPGKSIVALLGATPRSNFVSHFDVLGSGQWPDAAKRVGRYYLDNEWLERVLRIRGLGKILRRILGGQNGIASLPRLTPKKKFPLTWFGGSNWVILSRETAEYFRSAEAHATIEWFRTSAFPEESSFQTVILNSPYKLNTVNADRRAIYWETGAVSPRVLRSNDMAHLQEAIQRGCLFARKFDLSVDPEIVRRIQLELLDTSGTV